MCQKQPPEVFRKKGVLRNFAKFRGKHLCQSFFFNKVAGRPATLLKKRLWRRCFPVNFAKFLRTPFLTEHLWWLLLVCFYSLRSSEVKLLGKTILINLKLINTSTTSGRKYLLNFMPFNKKIKRFEKTRFTTAFTDSQFNYISLIWMFADKTLIKKNWWSLYNMLNHKKNFVS